MKKTEKIENDLMGMTDAELGAHVRNLSNLLSKKKIKGYEKIAAMSAVFILCNSCLASNTGTLTMNLKKVTSEKYPEPANFKITIKRT